MKAYKSFLPGSLFTINSKLLLVVVAFCLVLGACRKTYECKDQNGNVVGDFRASSAGKAEADCLACTCSEK